MDELELRLTSLHLQPMTGGSPEAVPESELAAIESALGAQLPDDYRWFLRRYGKSLFKEAVAAPTSDDETVPFMHFYGANASGDGVLKKYQFHEGEFPRGFVPIGEGSFGDLYLLAGKGPHRGSVNYWCHDAGGWDGDDEDFSCFQLIAPSFTDFIKRLVPVSDDTE